MKKSKRKVLAHETVEIVQQGWYVTSSGKTVHLRDLVERAKTGTLLFDDRATLDGGVCPSSRDDIEIEVTGETTFAALQRLRKEDAAHLGCLNFASAKNPGGGFLNGAEAQEEALSRSSALYECLLQADGYYQRNRQCPTCLYLDLVIGSPMVPFFRDDEGLLLEEPLLASVITAPAPNAGAISQNEADRTPEIVPTLKRRAKMVLDVASKLGVQTLVLGAWGCGVFRNDPRDVAKAFAELLDSKDACRYSFTKVVFAVFDRSDSQVNLRAFRDQFSREPSAA